MNVKALSGFVREENWRSDVECRDAVNNKLRRLLSDSPVFSCLLLEDHVTVVHPVLCGDVDSCMRVVLRRLSQHVIHDALPILPHVS